MFHVPFFSSFFFVSIEEYLAFVSIKEYFASMS